MKHRLSDSFLWSRWSLNSSSGSQVQKCCFFNNGFQRQPMGKPNPHSLLVVKRCWKGISENVNKMAFPLFLFHKFLHSFLHVLYVVGLLFCYVQEIFWPLIYVHMQCLQSLQAFCKCFLYHEKCSWIKLCCSTLFNIKFTREFNINVSLALHWNEKN